MKSNKQYRPLIMPLLMLALVGSTLSGCGGLPTPSPIATSTPPTIAPPPPVPPPPPPPPPGDSGGTATTTPTGGGDTPPPTDPVAPPPAPVPPPPPGGTPTGSFAKPKGIYVLDSQGGTLVNGISLRDNNIRDYPFVSGYTWRQVWSTFETSEGVYDFSLIDAIIAKLIQKGEKKLTLLIGNAGSQEPAYIAAHPGVTTRDWVDTKTNSTYPRAVPWDPYLQERLVVFTEALANHLVPDTSGTMVPLRDHPILDQVDLGLAGLGRIRNEKGIAISSLPGYTRQNLINAVLANLHAATDKFPKKFTSVGLWNVTDQTASPALWDDLRLAILGEFDGVKNPRVGFFQENLAASIDLDTGELTGTPSTAFAAPLYLSKDQTFIVFQALETWGKSDKTANTTPPDGINYGYTTYGSLYYELYVNDVDDPAMASSYQTWHDLFQTQ